MELRTEAELAQMEMLCDCAGPVADGVQIPIGKEHAERQVAKLDGWRLTHYGLRIRRDWKIELFSRQMEFFNRVASLIPDDGHYANLHREHHYTVWIELWTYGIRGLSQDDFVLAARINQIAQEFVDDNPRGN